MVLALYTAMANVAARNHGVALLRARRASVVAVCPYG